MVGHPQERAVAKVVRVIDDHAHCFIAHSPFVFVGSAGADGTVDISPKGDPPGFVKVLDDKTLAVPDRPGNKRIDTFHNVLANPRCTAEGAFYVTRRRCEPLRFGIMKAAFWQEMST